MAYNSFDIANWFLKAEAIRRIQDGKKTAIRLPFSPQPSHFFNCIDGRPQIFDGKGFGTVGMNGKEYFIQPMFRPGDLIVIHNTPDAEQVTLKVTDFRVERLNKLTVEDIEKESVVDAVPPPVCTEGTEFPDNYETMSEEEQDEWIASTARATYIGWCDYADEVRAKYKAYWDGQFEKKDLPVFGMDANPWVYVLEFERCENEDS